MSYSISKKYQKIMEQKGWRIINDDKANLKVPPGLSITVDRYLLSYTVWLMIDGNKTSFFASRIDALLRRIDEIIKYYKIGGFEALRLRPKLITRS